jgi:hypothetical protein
VEHRFTLATFLTNKLFCSDEYNGVSIPGRPLLTTYFSSKPVKIESNAIAKLTHTLLNKQLGFSQSIGIDASRVLV